MLKYLNVKMSRGFTLVELLVVIGIILVLSTITLPHYRAGEEQLALQRSAHKLAQDIRTVQEMAMSAREFQGVTPPVMPPGGYGIHFDRLPGGVNYNIYLFADLNNDGKYDSGERVEQIVLEEGVKIKEASINGPSPDKVDIAFKPPDPATLISPGNRDEATIILSLEQDDAQTRTISVNKAGLIAIK